MPFSLRYLTMASAMLAAFPAFADDDFVMSREKQRVILQDSAPPVQFIEPEQPAANEQPQQAAQPQYQYQATQQQVAQPVQPEIPAGWTRPEDAALNLSNGQVTRGNVAYGNTGYGNYGNGAYGYGYNNSYMPPPPTGYNNPLSQIGYVQQSNVMAPDGDLYASNRDQAMMGAVLASLLQYIWSQPDPVITRPVATQTSNSAVRSGVAISGVRQAAVATTTTRAPVVNSVAVKSVPIMKALPTR